MADEASTQEGTEPGFWARRIDKAYWPRRWWWLQPVPRPVGIDAEKNSVRRHDEASKTIRRVMMTLIAYGFFCLTLVYKGNTGVVKVLGRGASTAG